MAKKTNTRDLVKFTLGGREYLVKASIGLAATIEELTGKSCARLLHTFAAGEASLALAADVLRAAIASGSELESRQVILDKLDNEAEFLHAHRIATSILAEFFKPRGDDKPGNADAATQQI